MASFRFNAAIALGLLAAATPLRAGEVAITFDDLPVFGRFRSIESATALTDTLVAGIRRHRWPAIGFVNEIQLDTADRPRRIALLERWLQAGLDLGNHSYSHRSLTNTPVGDYIADVARGETVTKALLLAHGRTMRWFRYPYLETGPTIAVRHTLDAWLAAHGYRVAPVTLENSDWQFADVYDDAQRRGDQQEARRIRAAYISFTARVVPWYHKAAIGLTGRDPPLVFLLHASQLNADSIDALAAILRKERLRPVSLDRAMADPAYALPDTYVGPDGEEWLERWSESLHKTLPWASMPMVPAAIVSADARLDAPAPAGAR
ncbi:MAG TPA: polysaccharide deacetylase family protein [Sphingomonas sp.]